MDQRASWPVIEMMKLKDKRKFVRLIVQQTADVKFEPC
jgi:hypothetical protein